MLSVIIVGKAELASEIYLTIPYYLSYNLLIKKEAQLYFVHPSHFALIPFAPDNLLAHTPHFFHCCTYFLLTNLTLWWQRTE